VHPLENYGALISKKNIVIAGYSVVTFAIEVFAQCRAGMIKDKRG